MKSCYYEPAMTKIQHNNCCSYFLQVKPSPVNGFLQVQWNLLLLSSSRLQSAFLSQGSERHGSGTALMITLGI